MRFAVGTPERTKTKTSLKGGRHTETRAGSQEQPEILAGQTLKDKDLSAPRFTLIKVSAEERRRWRFSFAAGLSLQILVVFLLVWVFSLPAVLHEPEGTNRLEVLRITLPRAIPRRSRIPTPRLASRVTTRTVALPAIRPKPVSPPLAAKPPALRAASPRVAAVAHPQIRPLRKPTVSAPQVHIGAFSSPTATANARHGKRTPVHTAGFNEKTAVLNLPPSKIQTGGFGNSNGIPTQAADRTRTNVAQLGSFDRPEGPGSGNGTDGEHGASGVVASAGFGNGTAGARSAEGNNTAGNGEVRSAGFVGAESAAHAAPQRESQPQAAAYDPVEITSKPDPVYTAEARRFQIQGDVLLRVVFSASGRVRVLAVAHGLGHGLDQAAIRAAEQIQFKPARRDGRPVDTAATLRILFQLAD